MREALCYSTFLTLSTYALSIIFIGKHVPLTLGGRLIAILTVLLVYYLVSMALHIKLALLKPKRKAVGHAIALMFPLYAVSLVGMLYYGPVKFMDAAKPVFVVSWSPVLVPYSLAFWTLSGLIGVYFYDAAPYELFRERGRLAGMLGATMVFAVNYNQPLITHFWNLWDVIFFGSAFAYSYSVHRNPLALLIVYLLSEVPLWWCLLAPLGVPAFALYMVARFLLSMFFVIEIFLRRY